MEVTAEQTNRTESRENGRLGRVRWEGRPEERVEADGREGEIKETQRMLPSQESSLNENKQRKSKEIQAETITIIIER